VGQPLVRRISRSMSLPAGSNPPRPARGAARVSRSSRAHAERPRQSRPAGACRPREPRGDRSSRSASETSAPRATRWLSSFVCSLQRVGCSRRIRLQTGHLLFLTHPKTPKTGCAIRAACSLIPPPAPRPLDGCNLARAQRYGWRSATDTFGRRCKGKRLTLSGLPKSNRFRTKLCTKVRVR
jgi:hypothetical protein